MLRKINDPAKSPILTLFSSRTTNFFLSRLIPISPSKTDYKPRYGQIETPLFSQELDYLWGHARYQMKAQLFLSHACSFIFFNNFGS